MHSSCLAAVVGATLLGSASAGPMPPLNVSGVNSSDIPHISHNGHATADVVQYFYGFFEAKSSHTDAWYQYYNEHISSYSDSVIGFSFGPNRSGIEGNFTSGSSNSTTPASAISYPLFIYGDYNSAIVHFVDLPGVYGPDEIRTISVFDFLDGTASRVVDYWDGRNDPVIEGRPALDEYAYDLGLSSAINETASQRIQTVARKLNAAMSAGDANATAALFSYDAVFEDFTLRTREEGQPGIAAYLQRALPQLPYGANATVRHVLGNDLGGGYEWIVGGNNRTGVINGVTALALDKDGAITRLSAVWDGSRATDEELHALMDLAIAP